MWVPMKYFKGSVRLPSELTSVHPIFHDSIIKKCMNDNKSILPIECLGVNDKLSYEECMVQILESKVKKLRNKEVTSLKVLWKNHLVEGSTWEDEADMKSFYPYFFEN